eukprot:CAMPEP_0184866298 /NCGR_PEP_ID=MMETSP0580-20130426/21765_1 /TAXON_ID=1118495 /ORGANISM="Dactyliosolen fragilissimus" /LENGTH=629 /DNA_ID=CAMNT_0027365919 /DNA_START=40 /DNA_END=1929 /DNA_ORIENTATION=-
MKTVLTPVILSALLQSLSNDSVSAFNANHLSGKVTRNRPLSAIHYGSDHQSQFWSRSNRGQAFWQSNPSAVATTTDKKIISPNEEARVAEMRVLKEDIKKVAHELELLRKKNAEKESIKEVKNEDLKSSTVIYEIDDQILGNNDEDGINEDAEDENTWKIGSSHFVKKGSKEDFRNESTWENVDKVTLEVIKVVEEVNNLDRDVVTLARKLNAVVQRENASAIEENTAVFTIVSESDAVKEGTILVSEVEEDAISDDTITELSSDVFETNVSDDSDNISMVQNPSEDVISENEEEERTEVVVEMELNQVEGQEFTESPDENFSVESQNNEVVQDSTPWVDTSSFEALSDVNVKSVLTNDDVNLQSFLTSPNIVPGRTMLVLGTYAGDFNAIEYAQRLRYYLPKLIADKGITKVGFILNCNEDAAKAMVNSVDLPTDATTGDKVVQLLIDPSGKAGKAFGVGKGWKYDDESLSPYVKLFGMLFGLGAWATLPAVIGGYIGNPLFAQPWVEDALAVGQKKGRWPDTALELNEDGTVKTNKFSELPIVGKWPRRPLELATLRLQNMVGISLQDWKDLAPDADSLDAGVLTQLGGVFVIDAQSDEIVELFKWRDPGICAVANFEDILKELPSC